jgi:hypothetical protein
MLHLTEIIERIRIFKGLKNEGDVASILGFAQQTLSTQKKRGTIPFREIIAFCDKENLSADWVLLGVGPKHRPHEGILSDKEAEKESLDADPRVELAVKKVRDIYTQGTEDQKATLYGHIGHIYDAIMERKRGGTGDRGEDSEDRFRKEKEGKTIRKPA